MWVVVQHKGVTNCFAWHPVGLDVYLTKATLSRQTDLQSRWTGIGQNNSNSLKVLKNTSDVNNGFCCMWIPVFLVKGIYLKQVCQTVLNKCKWNYVEWIFLTPGQEKNCLKRIITVICTTKSTSNSQKWLELARVKCIILVHVQWSAKLKLHDWVVQSQLGVDLCVSS